MADVDEVASSFSTDTVGSRSEMAADSLIHYWLGKRYFVFVKAEQFLELHPRLSAAELDASWQAYVQIFPYLKQLASLREQAGMSADDTAGIGSTPKVAYFNLLGSLLQDVDHDHKDIVRSNVRQETVHDSAPATPLLESQAALPRLMTPEHCTSVLKEYGDRVSAQPNYIIQTVSHNPPMFRAKLSFIGRTFVGEARQKRLAKHYASQQACRILGVRN